LSQAAETLKNNRKRSKIKNLLLKYVPSKPKILHKAREVASSIWNLCKHIPINVAKNVVNSTPSLFASKVLFCFEADSALKDFSEQYTIDGRPRYDPESFLKVVKKR